MRILRKLLIIMMKNHSKKNNIFHQFIIKIKSIIFIINNDIKIKFSKIILLLLIKR